MLFEEDLYCPRQRLLGQEHVHALILRQEVMVTKLAARVLPDAPLCAVIENVTHLDRVRLARCVASAKTWPPHGSQCLTRGAKQRRYRFTQAEPQRGSVLALQRSLVEVIYL